MVRLRRHVDQQTVPEFQVAEAGRSGSHVGHGDRDVRTRESGIERAAKLILKNRVGGTHGKEVCAGGIEDTFSIAGLRGDRERAQDLVSRTLNDHALSVGRFGNDSFADGDKGCRGEQQRSGPESRELICGFHLFFSFLLFLAGCLHCQTVKAMDTSNRQTFSRDSNGARLTRARIDPFGSQTLAVWAIIALLSSGARETALAART